MIEGDLEFYDRYHQRYEQYVDPKEIYNQKQNYPELVVEDIMKLFGTDHPVIRDDLYAILLKRGVNKWFMVRKLLIRLKKVYTELVFEYNEKMRSAKSKKEYWYYKGKRDAYMEVRGELKTLCMAPRYVVFREKDIGYIDYTGLPTKYISRFSALFRELTIRRFRK